MSTSTEAQRTAAHIDADLDRLHAERERLAAQQHDAEAGERERARLEARAHIDVLVAEFNAAEGAQMQRLRALYAAVSRWSGGFRAIRGAHLFIGGPWGPSDAEIAINAASVIGSLDRTISDVELH